MKIPSMLLVALAIAVRAVDSMVWQVREHGLRRRFGHVGRNFTFDAVGSRYVTPELLRVGDDSFINVGAHVSGDVVLGDRVMIGPGVRLLSGNHLYAIPGYHPRFLRVAADNPELLKQLRIESDVWVGAGATVLGGVSIGTGSVIGSGAVVSRDIPPFVIAAGSPARPVRRIFDDAALRQHLSTLGVDDKEIELTIQRRSDAGASALPPAAPDTPGRFLYRGSWVTYHPSTPGVL